MSVLPLDGIRIADFAWGLSGPYSLEWLALLGAEVIHIESSVRAGMGRAVATPNQSPGFNNLNYAKKSCTINIQTEKGIELVKRLVKVSDIVADSFAYGVMERRGLGYEELKKIKPDIIVFSKNTMGSFGRERHMFGWGTAVISYAGLSSVTGYEEDGVPQMMGGTWPDYTIGGYSPFTILAALYHRNKTGQGMFIDYSMCEGVITMIPEAIMDYTMNGRVQGPRGNKDERMAPHNVYHCKDVNTWVSIAIENDEEWKTFCRLSGHQEWLMDERFSDLYSRQSNRKELDRLIESWTREHTPQEVEELLQGAGIAGGAVDNVGTLVLDLHLRDRNEFVEIPHPEVGSKLMPAVPIRMSATPIKYERAPLLGEHNEYVFGELIGLSSDEIGQLIEQGVIA
ncbi:MAG: CoA transferase [Dehalococcoidia bacterium]|nr:CoA transferase [Dehalococcoidia bacterium]